MSDHVALEALETRKAEIKRTMADLGRELEEIETAERVFKRYAVSTPRQKTNGAQTAHHGPVPKAMTEKIVAIVGEGKVKQPADVLNAIRERWLPDVAGNDVRPTLWRLVQIGRILKDDNGYRLPDS